MARENYLKRLCPKCETVNNYNAHFCYICGEDLAKYPENEIKIDLLDIGGNPEDRKTATRNKLQSRLYVREIIIFAIVLFIYLTLSKIYHF
jgi:hypothetical protein